MADSIRLSAPILAASEALPPLPSDPLGLDRHVSWVELAKAPGFHYGSHFVNVNADWITARIDLHTMMVDRGFYPPVLVAHMDSGERAGDVVGLGSATVDGRLTFLGALAWNDSEAAEKIAARIMTDVSVGLYPLQNPDTGDVLEYAVAEISLTTLPHLMGDSRILNAQNGGQLMDMPEMSADDRLAALEEMVGKLAEMVSGLASEGVEPVEAGGSTVEAEAVTAMAEDEDELPIAASSEALLARIATLEAQVTASQEKEARAIYANGLPIGAKVELTAEVAELLYPVWRSNPEALDVIKASLVKAEAPQVQDAPVIRMTSAWDLAGPADDSAEPVVYDMATALAEARITAKANGTKINDEYKKNLERVENA